MKNTIEQLSLSLDQPVELGFVRDFAEDVRKLAPRRMWTALLNQLAMMHVERVGACNCTDPRELEDWSHQHHGAYNAAIRAAIVAGGARRGLYKALDRELRTPVDAFGFGRIVRRDQALALKDFLSETPDQAWFKEASR